MSSILQTGEYGPHPSLSFTVITHNYKQRHGLSKPYSIHHLMFVDILRAPRVQPRVHHHPTTPPSCLPLTTTPYKPQ
jgi:hypothetical protein